MRGLSGCTSLVVTCVTTVFVIVCICQLRVRGGSHLITLTNKTLVLCV